MFSLWMEGEGGKRLPQGEKERERAAATLIVNEPESDRTENTGEEDKKYITAAVGILTRSPLYCKDRGDRFIAKNVSNNSAVKSQSA